MRDDRIDSAAHGTADSRRGHFMAGVRAVSPILLGIVPFATISGIAAVEIGMPKGLAIAMSMIMFAGAAQLASVQLLGAGAPGAIVVLTAVVINLRFAMYSASLGPHFQTLSARWKALFAYLLTDQAYAVSIIRFQDGLSAVARKWFYFGAAIALWATWQAGTAAGVFLGATVPASWSLDFAVPLTFMALAVPAIRDAPSAAAALAAGAVAVGAAGMPYHLNIITAAGAGIAVGLMAEAAANRHERKREAEK